MADAGQTVAVVSALTARDRRLIGARQDQAMHPESQLTALQDAARALRLHGIPFALIGGIAVAIRAGVPRATMDVDLAVVTTVSRAVATAALVDGEFVATGEFAHSANFRHANGEPVQLSFDVPFDEAIARAEPLTIQGVEIPVVRHDDLIVLKQRAAADPARRRSKALRDRADIELLRGDIPTDDEGW